MYKEKYSYGEYIRNILYFASEIHFYPYTRGLKRFPAGRAFKDRKNLHAENESNLCKFVTFSVYGAYIYLLHDVKYIYNPVPRAVRYSLPSSMTAHSIIILIINRRYTIPEKQKKTKILTIYSISVSSAASVKSYGCSRYIFETVDDFIDSGLCKQYQ